jgi:hypothetical protein
MSVAEASIPYEKQSDLQNNRTCGAACLSMVYRSLGKEVQQDQIWPVIAKQNRFGSLASTTHLMAQDALNRGFSAVAIQARHPLQVLRLCRENGVRAILNHRSLRDASTGHYSVLVDIDDKSVTTHDPYFGPSRHLPHAELIELWQPGFANSEIIGNVLIAIAIAEAPAMFVCEFCHTPMPPHIECPSCKRPVSLRPSCALGCIGEACIARMWNYICCPSCDYTWTFHVQPRTAGAPATAGIAISAPTGPSPQAGPWNLDRVLGELDKFCNHMAGLPSMASIPDLKKNVDFLRAGKERLLLAQAEELARREARQQQLAAIEKAANESDQAHRKKVEELNKPSAPLDGDALGRALLKNLGFTN